ncbi:two-component system, unclassified family, response regulator [Pustulibacterium marinum]|uniref:Two-component system, unclassified family, response regulator n=1 Tax=Pustulibacterium marinum TaxID=1224947 RepID=A0A1I7HV07_9FLAO|nr:response regulator [Pustulibacterium marinum]SFU64565.1 two-component system, unclassified family, response regulator [Pustulibacterium marinum]
MSNYILCVEDNVNDIQLIKRVFDRELAHIPIRYLKNGEEALKLFENEDFLVHLPTLILLDIKMRGISGLQVLEKIKQNEKLSKIPVVILSSSVQQSDLDKAYGLHVNSYVEKPKDYQQLKSTLKLLSDYWFNVNKN